MEEIRAAVDGYLDQERDIGSFPGAVYAVGDRERVLLEGAIGFSVLKPARIRAESGTIYDVASLTKPLVTATLALQAFAEGVVRPGDRVSDVLTELGPTDKSDLTWVDLLSHRGGFQAWYPLYTQGFGDGNYLAAIARRPLRYRPGTREIYSCLGYVLLHLAIERLYSESVENLSKKKIFQPVGASDSFFNPDPRRKYNVAATEWGNANERTMVAERRIQFTGFRNYMIWGEVNDGNAYYMGGLSGNAGLFATARDVYLVARAFLRGGAPLVPEEIVRVALRNYTVGLEENRGLGWQLQTARPDHPSAVLSDDCYGHTGFTGTSVWVDPGRGLVLVLLTNRLHPSFKPVNMQNIRRRFHEIVVSGWDRMAGGGPGP
jgi:serine-type D-Ala-D-Ala carboxypeptidase